MIVILVIAALVFGIVGLVEGSGRNWAAWGVVLLALVHLLPFLPLR